MDNDQTARQRATAVVVQDGKYLLVRDRGGRTFALPGGGIELGEEPVLAMARELHEETGLEAVSIDRLFTFGGIFEDHHVFRVEALGEARANGEVEGLTWWDGKDDTPVYSHVRGILDIWSADTASPGKRS